MWASFVAKLCEVYKAVTNRNVDESFFSNLEQILGMYADGVSSTC